MGVLMMAQILAFRRLLAQHGVTNGGVRHRLVKMALKDFESKLSQHAPVATDAELEATARVQHEARRAMMPPRYGLQNPD
jgi:hypothetical protein